MTWNAQIIVILRQLFKNSLSIKWYELTICSCLQLVCLNCNLFQKLFKHRIFCCCCSSTMEFIALRPLPYAHCPFLRLSSLGNFYSFSVDKIVLTLLGRFMHFMHNSSIDVKPEKNWTTTLISAPYKYYYYYYYYY